METSAYKEDEHTVKNRTMSIKQSRRDNAKMGFLLQVIERQALVYPLVEALFFFQHLKLAEVDTFKRYKSGSLVLETHSK